MTFRPEVSEPDRETAHVGRTIDAISECLPFVGSGEFIERFAAVVRAGGAGQVTAFACETDAVRCLLSRHFMSDVTGGRYTTLYLDGAFRDDPLFRRALSLRSGDCDVVGYEELLSLVDSRYLTTFRGCAGNRTKVAVLVAHASVRVILNCYFEDDALEDGSRGAPGSEIYRLLGRTLVAHVLRKVELGYPMPLSVLSERERQVCLGMLAGKSASTIAAEIDVRPSSVVTYRGRAYGKLGIASREELFSICRPA